MATNRYIRLDLGLIGLLDGPRRQPRNESGHSTIGPWPLFQSVAGSVDRPLKQRWRTSVALAEAVYLLALGGCVLLALRPVGMGMLPRVVDSIAAFVVPRPDAPRKIVDIRPLDVGTQDAGEGSDLTTSSGSLEGLAPSPQRLTSHPWVSELGRPGALVSAGKKGRNLLPGLRVASTTRSVAAPGVPVRVGGAIPRPRLVHRVDPSYPVVAEMMSIHGTVILEAIVDEAGRPTMLNVLRSCGELLDTAAQHAVKQWRYEPMLLAGTPHPFVLVVTISFRLT